VLYGLLLLLMMLRHLQQQDAVAANMSCKAGERAGSAHMAGSTAVAILVKRELTCWTFLQCSYDFI
jgi:hypothetical protein